MVSIVPVDSFDWHLTPDMGFTPIRLHDEGTVVTGTGGGELRFIDVSSGRSTAAAISPNGATLAVLSVRLQLWDIERAAKIGPPLRGQRRGKTAITWTDARLFTAGTERLGTHASGLIPIDNVAAPGVSQSGDPDTDVATIILWGLDIDRLSATPCRLAGRSLTENEWAEYLPGTDYDPFC